MFIGYLLKKKYPNIFWICEYRDLHVDANRDDLLWRSFQKKWNKKIIEKADLAVGVSKDFEKEFKKYNPNTALLRNGITDEMMNWRENINEVFDVFTISYSGSLYLSQNIKPLFNALKNIINKNPNINIQLIYSGKDSSIWNSWIKEANLEKYSKSLGLLPLKEAFEIQCKSHLNVVLTKATEKQKGWIPAKIYSSIASLNPILLISEGIVDSELKEIIEGNKIGKTFTEKEIIPIENYVYNLIEKKEGVKIKKEIAEKFTFKNTIQKFVKNHLVIPS